MSCLPFILRMVGAMFIALAGGGAGWLVQLKKHHLWQELHEFSCLLEQFERNVRYRNETADVLMHMAARWASPALAAQLMQCRAFSDIPVPPEFGVPLAQELQEGLSVLPSLTRESACATLRRMRESCQTAEQQYLAQWQSAARFCPKVGLCLGVLAAVLFL